MSEQDREIAKMEEEEALAIQKRLADEVDEDVFGLDDLQKPTEDQEDSKKIEVLDIRKVPRKKLLKMVEEESPELQGLIDDCRDKLRELDQELTPILDLLKSGELPRGTSAENYVMLRHNILLSYATNVCFYLSLKAKRVNIKNHPIIKRLGQFKKLITELDSTRKKVLPQIQLILEKTRNGETLRILNEKNSERDDYDDDDDDDLHDSDGEKDADEDEVDEQLSDEEIAGLYMWTLLVKCFPKLFHHSKFSQILVLFTGDHILNAKASKRAFDTAEEEILSLYDGIKSSKKFKTEDASEEDQPEEDDPAAIFGDTDSENDEPVFREGKDEDEDEDSVDEDLRRPKPQETQRVRSQFDF